MKTLIRGGLAAAAALTLVAAGAPAGLAHETFNSIDSMPSATQGPGSQVDLDAADRNAEQAAEAAQEPAAATTPPVPAVVVMDEEANETEAADIDDEATEVKDAPGAAGASATERQNEAVREAAEHQNEAVREAAEHQNEAVREAAGAHPSQSGHDDGHHGGTDSHSGSGRH